MYTLKNGILSHNGQPCIALGQSYYPSYHVQKVPVPPEGDRIGEMEIDLKEMREAGFNLCRIAALGTVEMQGKDVAVDFPLPDAFCDVCEDSDMAAMVRLQGYSMNLRGFDDATMLNAKGEKMPFQWSWFVRNSLSHPGIYEDNVKGTIASAQHFAKKPSVVSFQIYNEAAYPDQGFYDYHPHTIAAYREYLIQQGKCTAEEAAKLQPPTARPAPGEDFTPWVEWRLFQQGVLNEYLCDMGRRAKEGYALPENLTCHMSVPFAPGNAIRGQDYFHIAEGMDIVGITHYVPCRGPEFHVAGLVLDGAESAAAAFGKHTWLIEYNARTSMPPQEWERETYAALSRAFKGILYYQWRADYPYPGSPEPEGFGLLFNDKRKTPVYDTAVRMNALIARLSTKLAMAEKVRSGVAVLYSNYANAHYDAADNGMADGVRGAHDRYIIALRHAYAALCRPGVVVDVQRAQDLAKNPLGISTLILPMQNGLSAAEIAQVEAFIAAGGSVYVYNDMLACFATYQAQSAPRLHGIVYDEYDAEELTQKLHLPVPAKVPGAPSCDARLLQGDGYQLAVLTNYDALERTIENGTLIVDSTPATAVFYDIAHPDGLAVPVCDGHVSLPAVKAGAFVLLQ